MAPPTKQQLANRVTKVRQLSPSALTPYPGNSKTHSDDQIDKIAEAIDLRGFTNPVQVDEDMVIIAGHGRHAAAVKMRLATIPVVVIDWLTDSEKRQQRIFDNQSSELSDWAPDILASELAALSSEPGVDAARLTESLGFSEKDLKAIGVISPTTQPGKKAGSDVTDQTEFLLVIDCADENEQETLFAELTGERGLNVRIME